MSQDPDIVSPSTSVACISAGDETTILALACRPASQIIYDHLKPDHMYATHIAFGPHHSACPSSVAPGRPGVSYSASRQVGTAIGHRL